MLEQWEYQLRFKLSPELAENARSGASEGAFRPVAEVLTRHGATAISQFDAFANYVAEAERNGVDQYPLYRWTKTTIEDPQKKAKHTTAFAIYVKGEEVYDRAHADALKRDLRPLLEAGVLLALTKLNTNPANNPQPPAHLQ
jgi:hypothetical protein